MRANALEVGEPERLDRYVSMSATLLAARKRNKATYLLRSNEMTLWAPTLQTENLHG